jgi:hypothetical protein
LIAQACIAAVVPEHSEILTDARLRLRLKIIAVARLIRHGALPRRWIQQHSALPVGGGGASYNQQRQRSYVDIGALEAATSVASSAASTLAYRSAKRWQQIGGGSMAQRWKRR